MRYLRLGIYHKQKMYWLTVLGVVKSNIRVQTFGEDLLAASSHGGRQKGKEKMRDLKRV